MTFTTRFAPSPTGPLHLGHAYSALLANDMAKAQGGQFLVRIEDIDRSRARPEWEQQIYDDLAWLGLDWVKPVMHQSQRLSAYRTALQQLWDQGVLYICTCSRRDIQAAASAPQEGIEPAYGPDGLLYPGRCRPARTAIPPQSALPQNAVLRLDLARAICILNGTDFGFQETGVASATQNVHFTAKHAIQTIGDIVLARRDMGTSYHLSVVLDDADQKITHVVRGRDLFEATFIHVILQKLLGLPTPIYHHHKLIRDEAGKRLAKRDDARAIQKYRDDGASPNEIRAMVGLGPD